MRTSNLPLVALLALAGCRDFSLGQDLPDDAVSELQVAPLRVSPGGTLVVTFRLRGGAGVEVTVNGLAATCVEDGERQRWTYAVAGDEGELLNVVATASLGAGRKQYSAQAYLDAQPPPAPALDKLSLQQRPPGQADALSGLPGCLQGSDVRSVEVALDAAARLAVASAPAAADGSFAALDLGDNEVGRLYVFARDEAGNRSPPTVLSNDVEGPRLLAADFSPRTPRAGLPLRVSLRFDEALGAAPQLRLSSGAASVALAVSSDAVTGEWSAAADALGVPAGPASLTVDAVDALGNPSRVEQLVAVGAAEGFALDFVRLFRGGSGWSVEGSAGAAPFPSQVEARLVRAGVESLCGGRQAASDGSFEAIAVAATLSVGDEVRLEAFDETGGRVGQLALQPDFEGPTGVQVQVSAPLAGPSVPVVVTLTADEAIGPQTVVRVAGNPAARQDSAWGKTATFRYQVAGTEAHGRAEVEAEVADLAGNKVPKTASVELDLKGPQVSYRAGGAAWTPPEGPYLASYAPPDAVEVLVADAAAPASGVAGVTWQASNLRDGRRWDGAAYVDAPELPPHPGSAQFSLDLKSLVPLDERVAVELEAVDAVGNVSRTVLPLSRFEDARWISTYPAQGAALQRGYAVTGARTAGHGLCVASFACRAGGSCDSPSYLQGRVGLRFSDDGGRSWTDTSPSPAIEVTDLEPFISVMAFDPSGEHGLVVGTGLVLVLDAGCKPTRVMALPTSQEILSAAWDGDVAWLATAEGLFRSHDHGATWVSGGPQTSGIWNDVVALGGGKLLAVGPAGATLRWDGASWKKEQLTLTTKDLYSVARMPDGTLWAGGEQALLTSADDGLLWTACPLSLSTPDDWGVSFIRPSSEGPYLKLWDGDAVGWRRLGTDGYGYFPWSGWGEHYRRTMMDLIPFDGWAAVGVGTDELSYGDFYEWIAYTVSGGP